MALRAHISQLSRGVSLLEQALVIPVILGLVVAATDLASVLQTRSALEQGIKTALRCSYTVDGNCVQHTAAVQGDPFYDWRKLTYPPIDSVPLVDYALEAEMFRRPAFTFPGIRARVISEVSFAYETEQYRAKRTAYEASAPFPRYETNRWFPRLNGSSLEEPQFTYAPAIQWSPSGTRRLGPSPAQGQLQQITTPLLRLPLPSASTLPLGCRDPSGSSCETQWIGSHTAAYRDPHESMYLTLHVRGVGGGVDQGRVSLSYRYRYYNAQGAIVPSEWLNLQGQVFSGAGRANFIPRGLPFRPYMDEMEGSTAEIHAQQYRLIAVRNRTNPSRTLGVEVRVQYTGGAGDVFYDLDDIRLWTPEHTVQVAEERCPELIPLSRVNDPARACSILGAYGASTVVGNAVRVDTSIDRDTSEPITIGTGVRYTSAPPDGESFTTLLSAQGITDPANFRLLPSGSVGLASITLPCPENTGVAGLTTDGPTPNGLAACAPMQAAALEYATLTERLGSLSAEEQLRRSIVEGLSAPGAALSDLLWQAETRTVESSFEWVQPSCAQTVPTIPADLPSPLQAYPSIVELIPSTTPPSYPPTAQVATGEILMVSGRPATTAEIFREPTLATQWQCDTIGIARVLLGESPASENSQDAALLMTEKSPIIQLPCDGTLLSGSHEQRLEDPTTCEPVNEEQLIQQGAECGAAFGFTPHTSHRSLIAVSGSRELRNPSPESRGCFAISSSPDLSVPPETELVALNQPGTTPPSSCHHLPPYEFCTRTLSQIVGGGAGASTVSLTTAASLGTELISAAVPRSRSLATDDCESDEGACHSVSMELLPGGRELRGSAVAYVPLFSLLGARVPVRFSELETLEHTFVR